VNLLLMVYILSFENLYGIKKNLRHFSRSIARNLFLLCAVLMVTILLFAYYFLPYLMRYGALLSPSQVSSYKTFVITIQRMISEAREKDILKGIRGLIVFRASLYSLDKNLMSLWIFSTIMIPIFAFSALIFKPRNKEVISLSTLALLMVFLAKGPNEPFGNIYLWLYFFFEKWLGGLSFIKFIQQGMPLLYLSYSLLCAITVTELSDRISLSKFSRLNFAQRKTEDVFMSHTKRQVKKKMIVISITSLLILSISFTNFPIFTGDLRRSLLPIKIPSAYHEMNAFLMAQEGDFRVCWFPPSRNVFWNPSKKALDPWSIKGTKRLPLWLSSRPASAGAGILALGKEPEWKMFEYYIYDLLLDSDKTRSIGKLFGSENVKYVIYHNDIFEYEDYYAVLESLKKQSDLEIAFKRDYLYVFFNKHSSSYVYASDKAVLVIGSLDLISPLCALDGYTPYDYPLIFIEQYLPTKAELETYLKFSDAILFYGEKDFEDLFLSTICKKYLYSPADYQPSTWKVDFFYSSSWIKRYFLRDKGLKYDFDLHMKFVFSSLKNQTLIFPIKATEGTYEIWARVLKAPRSGNITFTIDDLWHSEVSTKSYKRLKGFKWIKVLETFLEEGEHTLAITNNFGTNAINVIAVVPKAELEQHRDDLLNLIKNLRLRILYLKEPFIMDRWPAPGMCISKVSSFYVPEKQDYIIAIRTNVTRAPNTLYIIIDDIRYTFRLNEGKNCNYIGPISLKKGNHKIIVQSKKAGIQFDPIFIYSTSLKDGKSETIHDIFQSKPAPYVINYKKINPAMIRVNVNATKQFILSCAESLDPLWIAYSDDGKSFPKATVNSLLNGFLIDKIGVYTITIEFVPERYFQIGKTVSLTTFLVIWCCLFYLKIGQQLKQIIENKPDRNIRLIHVLFIKLRMKFSRV